MRYNWGRSLLYGAATIAAIILLAATSISTQAQTCQRVWIEFRDKGVTPATFAPGSPLYDSLLHSLSPAALTRRAASGVTPVVGFEDVPISNKYLKLVRSLGVRPLTALKWENAISAYVSDSQYHKLASLPFIAAIHPVGHGECAAMEEEQTSGFLPLSNASEAITTLDTAVDTLAGYDPIIYHYGSSEPELSRINVMPLHAMGLDATGVRLGFLDTGFRWREVSSLSSRHVLSEYDYVFHDSVTANQQDDNPDQDKHGTNTFSTATGFVPDTLIGPAYNASIMLAKTEDIRSETPIEEDNYAAALEDYEAKGVDIVTSSLGYFGFDSGWTSYTYADMNGHTSITARAVERAARLGVLVVNAMGNTGEKPESHMISPADADSIISVGALGLDDSIATFSSRGPTSDGRIKPEICAPGVMDFAQMPDGTYNLVTGTSFATPLTASACCLIKQAHPEATAQEIRAAVMRTGDRALSPDTAYGWGRLNAYAAALELGTIVHVMHIWNDSEIHVIAGIASKFGVRSAVIQFTTSSDPTVHTLPLELATDSLIYTVTLAGVPANASLSYQIVVVDGSGNSTVAPSKGSFAFLGVETQAPIEQLRVSAYPNPATSHLTIHSSEPGSWELIDQVGREVLHSTFPSSSDGSVMTTAGLPAGAYFLRFISKSGETREIPIMVSK